MHLLKRAACALSLALLQPQLRGANASADGVGENGGHSLPVLGHPDEQFRPAGLYHSGPQGVNVWNKFIGDVARIDMRVTRPVTLERSFDDTRANRVSATTIKNECSAKAGLDADTDVTFVITVPGYEVKGSPGWVVYRGTTGGAAALDSTKSNLSLGLGGVVHEIGHALRLNHTYGAANDLSAFQAPISYDDNSSVMGRNGGALTLHDRERLGLVPQGRIFQAGGQHASCRQEFRSGQGCTWEITLTDWNARKDNTHYVGARIPFDPRNPETYFLVEYASRPTSVGADEMSDPALRIYTLYESDMYFDDWNRIQMNHTSRPVRRNVLMKEWQNQHRSWRAIAALPLEDRSSFGAQFNAGQVRIEQIPHAPGATAEDKRTTTLRIRHFLPNLCMKDFVQRAAWPDDRACVTKARRDAIKAENEAAPDHTNADGSCKSGFMPRAFDPNRTCVSFDQSAVSSLETQADRDGNSPRLSDQAKGPMTCKGRLRWRGITPTDYVCVTEDRWIEVRNMNDLARRNTNADGTCKGDFVRRNAVRGDRTCVPPQMAELVKLENRNRRSGYLYGQ